MPRVLVNSTAASASIAGEVKAYTGSTAPIGYFLCNGQTVSRTTYSALFAVLGTSHGQGDGSTTFNLPDYRGQFLRGRVDINTVTGSGTVPVSPNNDRATFTNHGVNRTGFRVRLAAGTLGGLAGGTDYFAIVVDANTLAFATTLANALAGTRITLTASSVNSAVLAQWEDPDAASRTASTVGGSSGGGLGSAQSDAMQNIIGSISLPPAMGPAPTGAFTTGNLNGSGDVLRGSNNGRAYNFDSSSSPGARTSSESRPKNLLVNYIIKY
jgi:hypothetical protein